MFLSKSFLSTKSVASTAETTKLKGDYSKQMNSGQNTIIFIVCLFLVLCCCVSAKMIVVPMSQSSNREIHFRNFDQKTGKQDYILFKA